MPQPALARRAQVAAGPPVAQTQAHRVKGAPIAERLLVKVPVDVLRDRVVRVWGLAIRAPAPMRGNEEDRDATHPLERGPANASMRRANRGLPCPVVQGRVRLRAVRARPRVRVPN